MSPRLKNLGSAQDELHVPHITFVILSYNRIDIIERTVRAALSLSWPRKDVIVVDNNSTDGSREVLKDSFSVDQRVTLLLNETNLGVCKGRNAGFRIAKGQILIYLDDDAIPPKDICENTFIHFKHNPTSACATYLLQAMPNGHIINNIPPDHLANYWGGAHAFQTHLLRQCGYLDEHLQFGGEEFDHTLAIRSQGLKVTLCDEVIVNHYGKTHTGTAFGERATHWMTSMCHVYLKWFPLYYAIPLVIRQWASLSFASIRRGHWNTAVLGPLKIIALLPDTLAERRTLSHELLSFYLSPSTVPSHCKLPFAGWLSRQHARFAASKKHRVISTD